MLVKQTAKNRCNIYRYESEEEEGKLLIHINKTQFLPCAGKDAYGREEEINIQKTFSQKNCDKIIFVGKHLYI